MLFHSYFHLQTRPSHSNPSHTLPSHFCTFIIFLQMFSGRPHFIKISLHLAALYPFSSFLFTPVSFVSSPSFVTVPFWLSSSIFFFFFFSRFPIPSHYCVCLSFFFFSPPSVFILSSSSIFQSPGHQTFTKIYDFLQTPSLYPCPLSSDLLFLLLVSSSFPQSLLLPSLDP